MDGTARTFDRMRTMNREIADEPQDSGEANAKVAFVCECARSDCFRPVWLDLASFEIIAATPRALLLAPGHSRWVGEAPTSRTRVRAYRPTRGMPNAPERAAGLVAPAA